jgi:hypothetical protein
VPFTDRNIAEDADARKELISKYSRMATPTLVIGDALFIGFQDNREEIERLLDTYV